MLLLVAAALSAEPHFSYPKLVTANGYGVAVLNGSNDGGVVLDVFSDHLYQQYSADQEPTRDLLYDSYFGARVGDESGWVTSASDYALVPGTNVIEIQRSMGDVDLTEVAFAPMERSPKREEGGGGAEGPATERLKKLQTLAFALAAVAAVLLAMAVRALNLGRGTLKYSSP